MTIAILALQGAFAEHQQMLQNFGVDSVLIRNLHDWHNYLPATSTTDQMKGLGLIIPGGESTAMMRIIKDEQLYHPIRNAIINGLPVFGTCAGLIMLDSLHLDTMNIKAKRNAYGRQLGSFKCYAPFKGIETSTSPSGRAGEGLPMTFIRAPYIDTVGQGVEVLATVDNHIVAARQGNQLVTAFHPELDSDTRVHELFVSMLKVEG